MTQPFTAPVLPAALTPLRAIQTAYRGYNFRSRLEARWAVFFDALGLSWEYEPEGFEFEGERYLPDFYVKEWSCYVEVKHGDGEFQKAERFAMSGPHSMLLVHGVPDAIAYRLVGSGDFNGPVFIVTAGKYAPFYYAFGGDNFSVGERPDWWQGDARLTRAITAARSARFEFGESGATL